MFIFRASVLGSMLGSAAVSGQSFIPFPQDVYTVQSVNYPGSSISYKKVPWLAYWTRNANAIAFEFSLDLG